MIVYGKNVVETLLTHPHRLNHLIIQDDITSDRLNTCTVPITRLNKRDLVDQYGEQTQGYVADISPLPLGTLDELLARNPSRIVILDGIMDPHNFGAIIRSAKAFRADAVIIRKKRTAPITATVYKASAGLIETLPIIQVANIHQTLLTLQKSNIWIYGLAGEATLSLSDVTPDAKMAWVLGSEGDGLSALVKKTCDQLVRIPMHDEVESLNVSVAAAVALFQTS